MKLIIGLGNPGEKFRYTRHNIGFMVVDKLVKDLLPVLLSEKAWRKEKKFSAEICKVRGDLFIAKPETYMNRSGKSVVQLVKFFKIEKKDLWIIHDDIDLPLGKIRIRRGGGSAGHNGIESIIKNLNTADFVRFRLGIGKGKLNLKHSADFNLHRREIERYVLSPFRDREAGELKKLVKKASQAVKLGYREGLEIAMNRFN